MVETMNEGKNKYIFLSDQLKQEDKKGTFIKLFDSYLKQPIIFRDNYWFKKLDKFNNKTTEYLKEKYKKEFGKSNDYIFIEVILNIRKNKVDQ